MVWSIIRKTALPQTIMGKLLAIPFILLGLVFINLAFSVYKNTKAIKQNGLKAIATIISHTVPSPSKMRSGKSSSKGGAPTMPTYQFNSRDGVLHQIEGTVNGKGKSFGKQCLLYYMPRHPEKEFVIEEDGKEAEVWAGCGGFCILFALLAAKFAGRKTQKNKFP